MNLYSSDKQMRLSFGGARRSATERGGAGRSGEEQRKKLTGGGVGGRGRLQESGDEPDTDYGD